MAKPSKTALQHLSARLGHSFADPELLKVALTHASARITAKPGQDNERLEFLGDRVLGLVIAELLVERFPKAREGELARWFNQLVRAETCAEVAQDWELGDFILMSGGEAGSGKSRLLDEFGQVARRRDVEVLTGRAWEAGGSPAFWLWREALRPLLRDTAPRDLALLLHHIAEVVLCTHGVGINAIG